MPMSSTPSRGSFNFRDVSSDLLYEVSDHVGVVTLNPSDAMNSLAYKLYADLDDTVRFG